MRALEMIVESPVGAVIFWSAGDAVAPVHYDEIDVIIIQVLGEKTWYVSKDPPTLSNKWKGIGEGPPSLDRFSTVDVEPGDLLYLPRGTPHTVQSVTESIHIAIGFVPVTVREAILAALDHLSDLDRPLRAGATKRADEHSLGSGFEDVAAQVRSGLEKLSESSQSDAFIHDAMARRRSRMIADMPKLPPAVSTNAVSLSSKIRRDPFAMAHIIKTPDIIEFCLPGEKMLVHPGAAESLEFIAHTPEFRVADIPGGIDDDIRIALVNRFLATGFLEVVDQG